MGNTYLITGGAGFIGANFVLYLLGSRNDVRVVNVDKLTYAGNRENLISIEGDRRHIFIQADICDKSAMEEIFTSYRPDYVVNFAAESHVDRSILSPGVFADTNVMGTMVLLNVALSSWGQGGNGFGNHRYLQVSTDEVYGSLPINDPTELFREDTPLNPHSPYSASKAAADMFVKAYWDTYGFPINITRCSNNYGPFQFPEKLIPLMISKALSHMDLPVYGDGLNVRDWLYVEDHCRAIDMVLERGRLGEVYNVGGHNERANIEIVKTIIAAVSFTMNDPEISSALITYVEDRLGHDRRYGIAPDKIKADLGWIPETSFEEGIAKTIDWYLSHESWMENIASGAYQSIPEADAK